MSICGNHPRIYTNGFCSLAAPIALQNIITMSVELTDNLMVGFLGDLALSAGVCSPPDSTYSPYAGNRVGSCPVDFGIPVLGEKGYAKRENTYRDSIKVQYRVQGFYSC
jgi:hypothetical protein